MRAGHGQATQVVTAFVDALGLSGVTLVAHDWGGPIGLATAERRPTAFEALVLTNTWGWPITGAPQVDIASGLLGGPLGRLLIRRFNLFVNAMIPAGHRLKKPTADDRLHRAVALRYTQGPHVALAEVDGLAAELERYHLFHATRADLLRALGHPDEARAADRLALELTANPAERAVLQERAD